MDIPHYKKTPKNPRFTEVWKQLHRNQKRFVMSMPDYNSKKECAEGIKISVGTIYGWDSDLINEAVDLYQEHVQEVAEEYLTDAIAKAALVKVAGLDSEDERIQQMTATEILDRYFGKPKQRTEHTGADGGPVAVELVAIGGIDPNKDI